jgi:hypothetical protein
MANGRKYARIAVLAGGSAVVAAAISIGTAATALSDPLGDLGSGARP